ncbi:hypothetical protein DJ010_19945 [Nocardioides silvaticus]|uniref:Uncharacterized protein n=1 Tax=Nocardioides silvaticus TaxID=2201891 RepID=A0A316TCV9_9ACTN|nr:hypothetical protein [Nocardioides silvaticus]PWN01125.1 hypothetical protein DJ010_19945 [Nocardioides silvaticus]
MLKIPLLRALWLVAGLMLLGHVVVLYLYVEHGVSRDWGIPRHFDLNAEANLAAWFQALPLLLASLVTLGLAMHYRAQRAPLAGRWGVLSGLFLLMSVDELAQLHDLFTGPLRRRLDLDFGILYFTWLLPAVVFLAFAAWYFLPLVRSLPRTISLRLVVSMVVYFGGAVVVEMLSGVVAESGRRSTPYLIVQTFEETCEIVGLLLALGTLVRMLHLVQPRMAIELLGPSGTFAIAPAERRPGASGDGTATRGPAAERLP